MAFGKKNVINLNPLAYNLMLLGESKCGKTTLIKQVCEKLAGDDGYLFLEIGQERGADAISGINFVNCPEWSMDYDELSNSVGFIDVVNDIIENKTTEYKNLQVLIWDTYDQLINIAEAESIRLWNKECKQNGHPEKVTKSINAAWGGYGKGEKKAIELMLGAMASLRAVGVSTIVIGHCKTKDVSDVVSGETYQVLTSDQQQNYFNAIKKNLHFLGLAYIDRTIVKNKSGNKISGETRRIKFRDDNYAVDSGSRFADIVSEVEMTPDAFISAITDAIKSEQAKSGVDMKTAEKNQKALEKAQNEKVKENEAKAKEDAERNKVIADVVAFFQANKTNIDVIKPVLAAIKEMGYSNPTEIQTLAEAKKIGELIAD